MQTVNDQVALLDTRGDVGAGLEAIGSHMDALGIRADFLSPVVQLSVRTPWVSGMGYLNFMGAVPSPGRTWFVYGEADRAECVADATFNTPALEVWYTSLSSALYLAVVEVLGSGAIGPGPAQFRLAASVVGSGVQFVNVTGQRQYLGTLFLRQQSSPLTLLTLSPQNLRWFQFYRVTLLNVFE